MTFAEIFIFDNSIIKGNAGFPGEAIFIKIDSENPQLLYFHIPNSFFYENMAQNSKCDITNYKY